MRILPIDTECLHFLFDGWFAIHTVWDGWVDHSRNRHRMGYSTQYLWNQIDPDHWVPPFSISKWLNEPVIGWFPFHLSNTPFSSEMSHSLEHRSVDSSSSGGSV